MPKPYSDDLRERVIEAVVAGASRREAAESFSLSASSAVRWLQRWRDSGSTRAKLSGGGTAPVEGEGGRGVGLVGGETGIDLGEIGSGGGKPKNSRGCTTGWGGFLRHKVTRQ